MSYIEALTISYDLGQKCQILIPTLISEPTTIVVDTCGRFDLNFEGENLVPTLKFDNNLFCITKVDNLVKQLSKSRGIDIYQPKNEGHFSLKVFKDILIRARYIK
jgi:hypothetical protein